MANAMLDRMSDGEEPTPADWEELVGNMDDETMTVLEKAVDELQEKKGAAPAS